MTRDHNRRRESTPYGDVEYETIQCQECTNDTITDEITHVYVIGSLDDDIEATPEEFRAQPVCLGCVETQYGSTTEVLTHDQLLAFYAEHAGPGESTHVEASNPINIDERVQPTEHGNVTIETTECSRCSDERVIDELTPIYLPVAIVDGDIHATLRVYCPDCREMFLDAPDAEGGLFADWGAPEDDDQTARERQIAERVRRAEASIDERTRRAEASIEESKAQIANDLNGAEDLFKTITGVLLVLAILSMILTGRSALSALLIILSIFAGTMTAGVPYAK